MAIDHFEQRQKICLEKRIFEVKSTAYGMFYKTIHFRGRKWWKTEIKNGMTAKTKGKYFLKFFHISFVSVFFSGKKVPFVKFFILFYLVQQDPRRPRFDSQNRFHFWSFLATTNLTYIVTEMTVAKLKVSKLQLTGN